MIEARLRDALERSLILGVAVVADARGVEARTARVDAAHVRVDLSDAAGLSSAEILLIVEAVDAADLAALDADGRGLVGCVARLATLVVGATREADARPREAARREFGGEGLGRELRTARAGVGPAVHLGAARVGLVVDARVEQPYPARRLVGHRDAVRDASIALAVEARALAARDVEGLAGDAERGAPALGL